MTSRSEEEISSLVVQGWMNVWEVGRDGEASSFADGKTPVPIWEPHLCVLHFDSKRLLHFRTDKAAQDSGKLTDATIVTVGGSKEEFDRHHRIRPLEKDMEIMLTKVNLPSQSADISTEEQNAPTPDNWQGRGDGERRSSISSEISEESVKPPVNQSRIVTFLTRQFRQNITRTKSSTKLDRSAKKTGKDQSKAGGEALEAGDGGIVVTTAGRHLDDDDDDVMLAGSSPLKRTRSLGRLSRRWLTRHGLISKGTKPKDDSLSELLSIQVRSSHSHESLCPSPPSGLHSIDLSSQDVSVRSLHYSVLDHGHCFQVSTGNGSKYYCCRTDEDRQKWLKYFRRCMHPRRNCECRTESSLAVCISEAKNLPQKKNSSRYFCEVSCDKVLYAKTSVKSDVLLWNELFEFADLPQINTVTISIYREADKKKKKDQHALLGYVNISVADISEKQLEERWYHVSSAVVGRSTRDSRNDSVSMRVKTQYQTVSILPLVYYDPLRQWLRSDYNTLVDVLEPVIDVKMKEKLATVLVAVFHKEGLVHSFLTDILVTEINKLDNDTLALRGNSIATKAVESYMKLVGHKYLHDTLDSTIKMLLDPNIDCEVDPMKIQCQDNLAANQQSLLHFVQLVWYRIANTQHHFPPELKCVFSALRQRCHNQRSQDVCDQLVSSCVFLRFICPAILSPTLFGFTQELPVEKASRNTTLVAKTVQSLANFSRFGIKEEWMEFMNAFVSAEFNNMRTFLQNISDASLLDIDSDCEHYEGSVDFGRELGVLHSVLRDCLSINEACKAKLNPLENILSRISELLVSPTPVEVTPVHRSSVKFRLDSSGNRSRIVSPPIVNDATPVCSSDDVRFVSTKSLNLQPPSPHCAASSTVSAPSTISHLSSGTATIPSAGGSRRRDRASHRDQVSADRPQCYQSTDAFVFTTPDVTAPPDVISSMSVSSVLTSSRRADEQCIDEDWQRMVAAASSDQINLVSFHESNGTVSNNSQHSSADAVSYMSSTVPRHSTTRRENNSGTVIFTLGASPPVKGRAAGVNLRSIQDACVTTSADLSPFPSKPLSFANPLYSRGTSQSKPAAVIDTKSVIQSSALSNNVASYPHYRARDGTNKRPQALPLAPARVGVGRSWQYRDLAGSTESLDSVLASRPASKYRGPIEPSLNASSCFSQSATHIDHRPPPVVPRRRPRGSFETSPSTTLASRGVDERETNFGALKRLWRSIELPASPSTSSGSARSYQSPARVSQSHITQRQPGTHLHSMSFDAGLSVFSSVETARRGHSCDSLLTDSTASKTHQLKGNRNPPSVDVDDHSELVRQFDNVQQQVADAQALISDTETRLLMSSSYPATVRPTNAPQRSPPGVGACGRWVVWL